jgi:hypothetical protein
MKNKAYSTGIIVLAVAALCFFSGCTKNGTEYGQLGLGLYGKVDSNLAVSNTTFYPDQNGRLLNISDARFYVSGVSLQNTGGSWYTIPNSLLLKINENPNYDITSAVPVGTYTAIKFYVGLDSLTNAVNPATDSSAKNIDSVLSSTVEPNMYFGAGEGFKFFYFSGFVLPQGSHLPVNINYQIGGNANRQLVTLTGLNLTIKTGQVDFVNLNCDYGKLLEGLSISTGNNDNGNSFGSGQQISTATLVADSIPNMFSLQ